MKFIFFGLLIVLLLTILNITSAKAVSPTTTPKNAATDSANPTNIDVISDLKERIASRVAQLQLVERRGIIGKTQSITTTQLTISDVKSDLRLIDVDELTRFASPSAKESFGISDITKGTTVSVLGLYNKQSRRLLARFVEVIALPEWIYGTVSKTSVKEFTVTVLTEKEEKLVDIERVTRTSIYTKEGGTKKAGFSKIEQGQRIMVVGFSNPKEKNRITASRIIVFPDLPTNPKIDIPKQIQQKPTPTPETTPKSSTRSARTSPTTPAKE